MTRDSAGCRLCVCPGDLCPRIRCPQQCIRGYNPNGCPICKCGGRDPQPDNAEGTPDPPIPAANPDNPLPDDGLSDPVETAPVEPDNEATLPAEPGVDPPVEPEQVIVVVEPETGGATDSGQDAPPDNAAETQDPGNTEGLGSAAQDQGATPEVIDPTPLMQA